MNEALDRLTRASIDHDYNPYTLFQWPDRLPPDRLWMSADLLSVHGTAHLEQLSPATLQALSQWESVNFYSLNVHGIRELLTEVVHRIHAPAYADWSEFFHRFIAEENDHMWFFAQFCLRYGAKIYPDKALKMSSPPADPEAESFTVFARILLFEEIVDFFNSRMAADDTLPDIVRQVNRIHHEDESRHIAAGRHFVRELHGRLATRLSPEELAGLEDYLRRYMQTMIERLYNTSAYRDAGIEDPYAFRTALLADPARRERHKLYLKRSLSFLASSKIFTDAAPAS